MDGGGECRLGLWRKVDLTATKFYQREVWCIRTQQKNLTLPSCCVHTRLYKGSSTCCCCGAGGEGLDGTGGAGEGEEQCRAHTGLYLSHLPPLEHGFVEVDGGG